MLVSIDSSYGQLADRVTLLDATDGQFANARPDAVVNAALGAPELRLHELVKIALEGYTLRPALGQRAVRLVEDPQTHRTSAELLPSFETLSFGELWQRVQALANGWRDDPVRIGDRVAILGSPSIDYTVVDIALTQLGAVSVPLHTAPVSQLVPILAETTPSLVASNIDYLDNAVDLLLSGPVPRRLVVFDVHPEVDDHRDAVSAATARLADAGSPVVVETLSAVEATGNNIPTAVPALPDDDLLAVLIYTSGSTGAAKGAMFREGKVANVWRGAADTDWDKNQGMLPCIVLSVLPLSHSMGRSVMYRALSAGGTVFFPGRSDLSTLLEDLSLVRPTSLSLVPRIWDLLHEEYRRRVDRGLADGSARFAVESRVKAQLRHVVLGGRFVTAVTASASISPELKAWAGWLLELPVVEGYGSTEAGGVFFDGVVQRPPVTDYKLVDVPELGYFHTDRPYPRGELLVKSEQLFPGYYNRPEITAAVFDEDGFYRTGDIVAEPAPDRLVYVDRRNNVLKLSQGEFVTLSKLEAAFGTSALVRQIFIYGNSARSYLLAVVVPTSDALACYDSRELRSMVADSVRAVAKVKDLQSYEIPRDFLLETTPFTVENGLLTGLRKLAWPKLKERYGSELEQLYIDLADNQASELRALRHSGADALVLDTVARAASALLGGAASDVRPDAQFTDLGGDSLSALTFGNLLREIFDVDVPVGVIVSPASDLQAIAHYIETQRSGGTPRPTYAAVHGPQKGAATEVQASDLSLDRFLDATVLAAAPTLPRASSDVRTVLLTGATGFLGRYLALEWLERMDLVDGTVICLVRARDDTAARARLDAVFDSGDPELLTHYRALAAGHLEVIAGDKGEENLGLDQQTWARLADTVDLIIDPAALVNHVLPYSELFGPNALGTAELIRIALTTTIKPFAYVSTIGVLAGMNPTDLFEDADIRQVSAARTVDESYANGYANSKWAGEVLLREAHDLCGLAVSVFRCDMILADTSHAGQLNLPDMFTRMMLSLVLTGIAPASFYHLDPDGHRQRAHYDGLPVEFIAEAISTLGARVSDGFQTYHVMNPYDDGIGMDEFVDWLVAAGYAIQRIPDYASWLQRFETTLRALPDKQRQASLLPLLHNYQHPDYPMRGSMAPTDRFRAAVQEAKIGPDKDIPHISAPVVVKYITDLQLLNLV